MAEVSRKKVQDAVERADEYILEEGKPKKAIKLLEDLLKELETTSEEYYEVVLKLATTYRDNKSYSSAKELLKRAIPEAKKFDEDIYLADMYSSLSFINLQQRNFADARKYAKKGLDIIKYMRGFKAEKSKANIYAVLGNIYFTTKDYKDALKNYRKALKKSKDIGFKQREITVRNDIANVYIEKDDLSKAKNLLLNIKQDAESEHPIAVPQVFLRLARVEYMENSIDRAKAYIEQAIDYAKKMGWRRDIAEAREAMAEIYKKEGREKNRVSELKKAREIYKEIGLKEKAKNITKKL